MERTLRISPGLATLVAIAGLAVLNVLDSRIAHALLVLHWATNGLSVLASAAVWAWGTQ